MFCSKCGAENDSASSFCAKCGAELNSDTSLQTEPPSKEPPHPTPVILIVTSWIVFALSLFNRFLGTVLAIIVGLGVLWCSIMLIINKNRTAKLNGKIILIIWIITFIIGFLE